jgi:hypothetical protein
MIALFRVTSGFEGGDCLALKIIPVSFIKSSRKNVWQTQDRIEANLKEIKLTKWDLHSATKPVSASAPVKCGKKTDLK